MFSYQIMIEIASATMYGKRGAATAAAYFLLDRPQVLHCWEPLRDSTPLQVTSNGHRSLRLAMLCRRRCFALPGERINKGEINLKPLNKGGAGHGKEYELSKKQNQDRLHHRPGL